MPEWVKTFVTDGMEWMFLQKEPHEFGGIRTRILWIELCSPKNAYVEALTFNVIVLKPRVQEVIKFQ